MELDALIRALAPGDVIGERPVEILDLAYDTRHVDEGALFFCVPGATRDGHELAGEADAALMKDTETLFAARCVACHGDKAQGSIGPNLTDNAWIHGKGSLSDIFTTIDQGVLAKGMPAWGKQLSPIAEVFSEHLISEARGWVEGAPGKS